MYASYCINPEIPFLQPEDKGLTALSLLEELKLVEIPLVDGDKYLGLITELDLLDYDCIDGEIMQLNAELKKTHIKENDHIFDVASLMVSEEISVLPVLSNDNKYLGSIDHMSLLKNLTAVEGINAPGGVLELEMATHEYSMSEISRIVESNDAKIINSSVHSRPDSKLIHVTLKLNKSNLSGLIRNFERYSYTISAYYQQDEYEEELKKRYEGFLRYLNT